MIIVSNWARFSLETLAYPYHGRSTRYQERGFQYLSSLTTSKKFVSCVLPGFGQVWTRVFLLQIALMRLDLPTLLLPINAYSGLSGAGQYSRFGLLLRYFAEIIFIYIGRTKYYCNATAIVTLPDRGSPAIIFSWKISWYHPYWFNS